MMEDRPVVWRLLADVPPEEVQRLLSIARRRRFRRGEVVFHRDDPADSLHLIVSGRFAVRVTTPLGDTATIAVRGPGESFGEIALLAEENRRTATVEALEDAETFCVYEREVAQLRHEYPSVDRVLFAFLAGEVRMLNERLLEALYLPAERRLLRRLVELADLYGTDEVPLTQEELAQLAGTSRATVNRVLREEQGRGTIERRRGKTVVLDAEELARRAR
jgi:CRP-like cAMP-binding protein